MKSVLEGEKWLRISVQLSVQFYTNNSISEIEIVNKSIEFSGLFPTVKYPFLKADYPFSFSKEIKILLPNLTFSEIETLFRFSFEELFKSSTTQKRVYSNLINSLIKDKNTLEKN